MISSQDDTDDFDSLFKELRAAYAAKLPSKFNILEEAIGQARCLPNDTTLSKCAANEAHKIKGTAGSHGFTEVSLQAEIIEELLESLPPKDQKLETKIWQQIEEALAKGKALADHIAASNKPDQGNS